ncbi:fumarylacetoacetate hydrolase family protein [Chelatococcus asaccharovorans]|uniref:2-keto-4-pentenoate hydratase/2-oxohepta-3-ene-1,7-dioic acid hydratase in catechol pathway n=1 Tax=Chelatococcus asaccharovorans TaxID=28210 RepID=A0A2V3UED2_9HYPH|nr:fumarylacetoacetate hydrolase family protein [Chelatococcus asaccharovorans]MBS7707155.1 fumarylacetoacetate hydrolase family protein [Chelatococcus asaccharovorans]PXW63337.1 2-keto-4-pentenoate hydratase/2-oxohepta-3-ene-1,7-dioic acid hydratase in catechol pathway [Chelatococcus asaccharovorans]
MRLGLAEIDGVRALVALRDGVVVRPGGGLPADPLAILIDLSLRAKASAAIASAPAVDPASMRLLPPLAEFGKIICVGLNYADHAAESPYDRPKFPVFFLRVDTGIIGPNDPIIRPLISDHLDFEAELAVVLGSGGRRIAEEQALGHVAAYTVFNDGSIRDWQFKGPQWTLGKNFDNTAPIGPFLVSSDAVPTDGKGLRITTRLNDEIVQDANTNDLLFPIPELIARVSEAMTLKPGDIIVTGTPAGVGFARKPPLFMKAGDVCEVEVEGIGKLVNPIVDEAAS